MNPTTPNLLAQYAVASPAPRNPSVEATVAILRGPLRDKARALLVSRGMKVQVVAF